MRKSRKPVSHAELMEQEIHATCKILESVAKSYRRGSAEHKAIRQAAEAFVYVRQHEALKIGYEAYRRSCTKPFTKAQIRVLQKAEIQVLQKMGIIERLPNKALRPPAQKPRRA